MKAAAYLITGMITGCVAALAGMESKTNFVKGYKEISGNGSEQKTLTDVLLTHFNK